MNPGKKQNSHPYIRLLVVCMLNVEKSLSVWKTDNVPVDLAVPLHFQKYRKHVAAGLAQDFIRTNAINHLPYTMVRQDARLFSSQEKLTVKG